MKQAHPPLNARQQEALETLQDAAREIARIYIDQAKAEDTASKTLHTTIFRGPVKNA